MSSDRRNAFLRAILAAPADDAPRLVFADWLDEHGDAGRAESIRVQCELARHPLTTSKLTLRGKDLRRRERELLDHQPAPDASPERNRHLWAEGVYRVVDAYEFSRGFVSRVETTLAAWCGEACGRCQGRGKVHAIHDDDYWCEPCRGSGRIGAVGPAVVRAAPVTEVVLTDREPSRWHNPPNHDWYWVRQHGDTGHLQDRLPPPLYDCLPAGIDGGDGVMTYPSHAAALSALSDAAVAWARAAAGLPAIPWKKVDGHSFPAGDRASAARRPRSVSR